MTLIPVETAEDFSLAEQFVIPHEETCVSLASLVRRKTDKLVLFLNSEEPVVSTGSTTVNSVITADSILGILNLDSTIYHCIPDPELIDVDFLKDQLPYLMKKPVRCISGEKKATDFLINVFAKGDFDKLNHPAQVYDYKMLRWLSASEAGVSKTPKSQVVSTLRQDSGTASSTTGELSGGEEIIRCTEHDMEILHPLQKDYMKDEVAVPGRTLTDAEVDISLRQILKNQLCFALTVDGDIVAKANTNAIGINKVQIGGVYTHPLYRGNGYAAALVTALCNRALRSGKEPVLFVKEKNMPAFSLYQKIGFEECGRYAIAYY